MKLRATLIEYTEVVKRFHRAATADSVHYYIRNLHLEKLISEWNAEI